MHRGNTLRRRAGAPSLAPLRRLGGFALAPVLGALVVGACSHETSVDPGFSALSGSGANAHAGTGGAGGDGAGATTTTTTTTTATTTTTTSTSGQWGGTGAGPAGPIGGDRPVDVHVPPSYNPAEPTPLVILLHGYSAAGELQEFYLDFTPTADARGFLYAYPDGTQDSSGLRFWNATDACCNLFGSDVDDSSYLEMVVRQIQALYNVDPKRIYFIGHSNGGFMSYRMACDHADTIAAVAVLAGDTWSDDSACQPSEPVSVLHIHGTLDPVILYGGGSLFGNDYPSAHESAATWAQHDGCHAVPDDSPPWIDLDGALPGAETEVERYDIGCDPGRLVELWSIHGAGHVPIFGSSFRDRVIDFLYAHPKP